MNSKLRMLKSLNGERVDQPPVTPHWWGVYKFQLAGVMPTPEDEPDAWTLGGANLARVDSLFYETFHPDLLHLSTGHWQSQPGDEERRRARRELRPAVMALNSKQAIDDYIAATTPTEDEVFAAGVYDHVSLLAERYGEDALILLNEGNPVCEVFENNGPVGNFDDALIATIEHPDNLAYLLWKLYDAYLVRMKALQRAGAHGYIGSETCVSPDILSPRAYREIVFPAQQHFYHEVARMGLIPVTYFLGDILPILDDITRLGARGLMIEEPKKGFHLDVDQVYRALDGRMTLFGNLDSIYHLLMGTPAEIAAETRRQVACAADGGFIMACGSPLCFDTPKENVQVMLRTVREG